MSRRNVCVPNRFVHLKIFAILFLVNGSEKQRLIRMKQHPLGKDGPHVSALGLGCMAFSGGYGTSDDAESIATIRAALDADGAEQMEFLDSETR